jgi:quinol monooxygenase YgiN
MILKNNVPKVKAEQGCVAYEPLLDVDGGLQIQQAVRENVVTIVEAWESLDHLNAHLKTPHMRSYRDAVADYVEKVTLQLMAPA